MSEVTASALPRNAWKVGEARLSRLASPGRSTPSGTQAPDAMAGSAGERRRLRTTSPLLLRVGGYLQVAASLIWLPQAGLTAYAIQTIAHGGGAGKVAVPAGAVLVLGLVRAMLDAAGARLAFRSARQFLSDLREHVGQALAARSPLDTARPASGLAASAIAEQAEMVVPYLSRFQPARLRATIVPLVLIGAVLSLSWAAALVLVVTMPLIPVFMALVGWRAKAASEEQLVEAGGMNAFLLDRLRGLATIRALDAVDRTALRLRASAESLRSRTMAVLRVAFLSSAVLELFSALGVAMVAVYVGFHLLGQLDFGTWNGRLTLGQGFFILLLAPACFEPLRDLAAVWHDRAAGVAALDALASMTDVGPSILGAEGPISSAPPCNFGSPSIGISKLGFTHAGSDVPVFAQFDLTVRPGEKVAVLGPSGSGKSTLLALIAGLSSAAEGQIAIGGVPLSEQTAADLRMRMAWIGQRSHIFAGSLRANIALGRPWIDAAAVEAAILSASLDQVAAGHGSRPIGESGSGLSGGEALRLALARAAADERADLILADEPTAHLDATTAAMVTEGLMGLSKQGRTLIVATHDPVLALRMDRIVRLGGRS